ncbi:class II aldolase/adducin family protein [Variovorax sp. ZT4R33]|uniref:class II aldolase/adducin family protein n=1 Tax=Variovorax sp. ZT4R33 TaxID=3443743 RepID=UPI003F451A74
MNSSMTQRPAHIEEEEWVVRQQLAACYRLVGLHGWTDLVFTHISARVPGPNDHFLLNPFGSAFDEVTASSLVRIDLDGNVVDGSGTRIHPAGFVIHSAVHGARADAGCVIHTHSTAGMALSMLQDGLQTLSQHAALFHGRLGYHEYEGFALDLDERRRLVVDLADHPAMILRNHGLLVVGRTVPEAFSILHHLEKAAQAQLLAMSTGAELCRPSEAVSVKTAAQGIGAPGAPFGEVEWPAMLRRLDRVDPSYRT